MYPLKAILIGLDPSLSQQARRELLNRAVHLEVEFDNAVDAFAALRRSTSDKRLLILSMASICDLESLSHLAVHFPGWPIVALVDGYDPKASLGEVVVNIIRTGASQILSLPIQTDDFKAALERIALQYVYSLSDTKVIAVAGATGGSGTTSVALNLAFEIADRHGLRCVLADLSLRMGVITSHLNIEPTHTILDLLRNTSRVDAFMTQQVLIRVADNFEILAGPDKLVTPVTTSANDLARVIDTLKQIADIVVLDIPCTYDDLYFETITAANQVILIGEQKLPSIRAMKMVREAIKRDSATEHLILNKYEAKNKGFSVERLLKPLEVSALHTVARDDLGMSAAMDGACTLRMAHRRSPALADIVALADRVLAIEPKGRTKPMGLFSRLGRALVNS